MKVSNILCEFVSIFIQFKTSLLTMSIEWYDGSTSVEAQEKFRENALRSLANATVQLSTFQYAQGGALAFDDNGDVLAIESVRVYDCPAMHNRMASDSTESDNLFCENWPFRYLKSLLSLYAEQASTPFTRPCGGLL